ncbi:MAG: hypothetical protein AAF191_18640 [Verrucomicrobiota bacterium]
MNTPKGQRIRVQDYTEPQRTGRKSVPTITDSGGLYYVLSGKTKNPPRFPRLRSLRHGSSPDGSDDSLSS